MTKKYVYWCSDCDMEFEEEWMEHANECPWCGSVFVYEI